MIASMETDYKNVIVPWYEKNEYKKCNSVWTFKTDHNGNKLEGPMEIENRKIRNEWMKEFPKEYRNKLIERLNNDVFEGRSVIIVLSLITVDKTENITTIKIL